MKLRHFIYWSRSVLSGYGTGAQQATARDYLQQLITHHRPPRTAAYQT